MSQRRVLHTRSLGPRDLVALLPPPPPRGAPPSRGAAGPVRSPAGEVAPPRPSCWSRRPAGPAPGICSPQAPLDRPHPGALPAALKPRPPAQLSGSVLTFLSPGSALPARGPHAGQVGGEGAPGRVREGAGRRGRGRERQWRWKTAAGQELGCRDGVRQGGAGVWPQSPRGKREADPGTLGVLWFTRSFCSHWHVFRPVPMRRF